MITEVAVIRFKKRKGKLYYVNRQGNLVEMDPVNKEKSVVASPGIEKKRGYLYFLNREGNIAQAKLRNH